MHCLEYDMFHERYILITKANNYLIKISMYKAKHFLSLL